MTSTHSSRLLIAESPLQVLPSLAVAIGLNEALVLQQIHYWLNSSQHDYDGRTWVYNTLDDWNKQFPFWGLRTLRRTIDNLREQGLLLTANYNQHPSNRTLWYSIDYDALDTLTPSAESGRPSGQSDHMVDMANMDRPFGHIGHMLKEQETTAETTQENGGGGVTHPDPQQTTSPHEARAAAARGDEETVEVLRQCGLDRDQAAKAALLRSFTPDELERLKLWRKQATARKPGAVLWSNLKYGDLPDDLPPPAPPILPELSEEEKRERYLANFYATPTPNYRSR